MDHRDTCYTIANTLYQEPHSESGIALTTRRIGMHIAPDFQEEMSPA